MTDAAPGLAEQRFAEYQRLRKGGMEKEAARSAALKLTGADFRARELEREDLRQRSADANRQAITQRREAYKAETDAGAYRSPVERDFEQARQQQEDETGVVATPVAIRTREDLSDEERGASDIATQRRKEGGNAVIAPEEMARIDSAMGGVAPGALPNDLRVGMNKKKTMLGKFNFLRHELGEDNVRGQLDDSGSRVMGFQWREGPDKPWKPADPGVDPERPWRSMIQDLPGDIADVIPDAIEAVPGAVTAAAGEAMGGIPGAVVMGAIGDAGASYLRDAWSRDTPGEEAPDAQNTSGRDATINVLSGMAGNTLPLAGRFFKPGTRAIARRAAREMPVDATAARKLAELAEAGDVETARALDIRRPTSELAVERGALGRRTGVDFSGAELAGSRDLLQQEDALSAINKYADQIGEARVRRTAQAEGYFRRAVNQIGGGRQDPAEVGKNVVKLRDAYLDSLVEARKAAVDPIFKEADLTLGDARLPAESFQGAIKGVLGSIGRGVTHEDQAIKSILLAQLKRLEGGEGLKASELGNLLSVWGRASAKGSRDVFGPDVAGRRVKGIANSLFAALQKDLEAAATGAVDQRALAGQIEALTAKAAEQKNPGARRALELKIQKLRDRGPDSDIERGALLLQEARGVYADMSPSIDRVDNDILNNIVGLGESGKNDLVGGALLASKSPAQIRDAIQVLKTAGEHLPEYQDVARQAIGDALSTIIEGAKAGNAERNQGVFTSMAKFATSANDKRGQINALLSGLPKGEERQALAMWEDARRVAEILSDRGLPPGSPTASRLNAAQEATANAVSDMKRGGIAGAAAGVAERKLRAPRLDQKQLVAVATDPDKRDAFLKLMAQQRTASGRLISKATEPRAYAEAWLRAAVQMGLIDERDDFIGEAAPKDIQREQPNDRRAIAQDAP